MRKAEMTLIKFTAEDVIATSYVSVTGVNTARKGDTSLSWYGTTNYRSTGVSDFTSWYGNNVAKGTNVTYDFYTQTSTGYDKATAEQLVNAKGLQYKQFEGQYEYKASGVEGHTQAGFYQTKSAQ